MLLPMVTGIEREKHGRTLREVGRLADAGSILLLIDSARFTLAKAADAHRHLASGSARGQVVTAID